MEFRQNECDPSGQCMGNSISENSVAMSDVPPETMSDVPQEMMFGSENSIVNDVQVSSSNAAVAVSSTFCFAPNEPNCSQKVGAVTSEYLIDSSYIDETEPTNDIIVTDSTRNAINLNNIAYGNEISKDQLLFRVQQIPSLSVRPTIADGALYLIPSGDDSKISTAISPPSESNCSATETEVADGSVNQIPADSIEHLLTSLKNFLGVNEYSQFLGHYQSCIGLSTSDTVSLNDSNGNELPTIGQENILISNNVNGLNLIGEIVLEPIEDANLPSNQSNEASGLNFLGEIVLEPIEEGNLPSYQSNEASGLNFLGEIVLEPIDEVNLPSNQLDGLNVIGEIVLEPIEDANSASNLTESFNVVGEIVLESIDDANLTQNQSSNLSGLNVISEIVLESVEDANLNDEDNLGVNDAESLYSLLIKDPNENQETELADLKILQGEPNSKGCTSGKLGTAHECESNVNLYTMNEAGIASSIVSE